MRIGLEIPIRGWNGAGDRIRTGDIDLGKVALYQLSYSRACGGKDLKDSTYCRASTRESQIDEASGSGSMDPLPSERPSSDYTSSAQLGTKDSQQGRIS